MKLLIAIVQDEDAHMLMDDLSENGFRMTKLASTGGFLKAGNTTLLLGIDEDRVDEALRIIEEDCKSRKTTTTLLNVTMPGEAYVPLPMEVQIGGATIFMLDVEKFIRI
ncbi:cyclic-di-AMP receptor [Citroniella saccharovorans]|uniref:Cyclic-di-AMP receptor n=1 Tax=Citroniella saccharovorans TaxID=2053367 RepID=A0AAW9N0F4_9FIRM|nr:cyclic-di-AMP receptor [Citroniella saccharovorans]MEB3430145.1 cyclic-di-AMP receptor [Citroniella saccharovorans]